MLMRRLVKCLAYISLFMILSILAGIFAVQTAFVSSIVPDYSLATSTRVAIIFGAGLNPDGTPREMLEARVTKGIELLQQGKVGKLFLTGASDKGHNEPDGMKRFANDRGVQDDQLILDYEGDTTFDSCANSSTILRRFHLLENNVILVTQKFHLPRALYLCNNLGVRSVGVAASSSDSAIESAYAKREYAASVKAWLQINLPFTRPYFEKF